LFYHKRSAFSMIELVFVIVILGILAAIAVPKFAATRTDAQITKGKSDVSSIRSAIISERQSRLIRGDSSWINSLSASATTLFDGNGSVSLLMYGIASDTTDGHWRTTSTAFPYIHYAYKIGSDDCLMDYNSSNGKFTLKSAQPTICDNLIK